MGDNHYPIEMALRHGYCRDCKWWYEYLIRLKATIPDSGACTKVRTKNALFYPVATDYSDEIETAPDFGCVQWEEE